MFETGYKEFDRALKSDGGLICQGNVISNTMYGFHVRARKQTECNGFVFPYGKLQESDLAPLSDPTRGYVRECSAVLRYVKASKHFEENSGWISIIRHCRDSDAAVVIHGVIVTDLQHKLLRRFDRIELLYSGHRQFQRSAQVLDSLMSILCKSGTPVEA